MQADTGGRKRHGPRDHPGWIRVSGLAGLSIAAVAAAFLTLLSPLMSSGGWSTDTTAFAQGRGTPLGQPPTLTRTTTPAVTSTPTQTPTQTFTSTATSTSTVTQTPTPLDLSITKDDQLANHTAHIGGNITYKLSVANVGGTAATGITVIDPVPAGLTLLAAADNSSRGFVCQVGTPSNPNQVTCTGGTLGPTGSATSTGSINVVVAVNNACVAVSPVVNTAQINPPATPGGNDRPIAETNTSNNTASVTTIIAECPQITLTNTPTQTNTLTPTVTQTPTRTATPTVSSTPAVDVSISKSSNPIAMTAAGSGAPNDVLQYILTLQNCPDPVAMPVCADSGPVTITDTLPLANASFLNATSSSGFVCGAPDAQNVISCQGGSVGARSSAQVTITLEVTSCPGGGYLFNTASVIVNDNNAANNIATLFTSCSTVGVVNPPITATITNTVVATLTRTATITRTPTTIPAFATGTTTATPGFAFLKLSSSGTVNPGQAFTYTLQLVNQSGSTISNVNLSDPMPAQVAATSVTADNGLNCSISTAFQANGTVLCTGGSIPSGTTATVTIQVLASPTCTGSPIINTATISQPAVAQNTATNSTTFDGCATVTPTQTVTSTVTLTPTFDLAIAKIQTTGATVSAGSPVVYQITVSSTGSGTINNISFTDQLPAGFTPNSVNPYGGTWNGTCSPSAPGAGALVTCSGGSMTAGNSLTLTISGAANGTTCTTMNNQATLTGPADSNAANNTSAVVVTTVQCPNLGVTKTVATTVDTATNFGTAGAATQSVNISGANQTVTWRLTVTNNGAGGAQANAVVLTDAQPQGFSAFAAVPVTGTWSCIALVNGKTNSNDVQCTLTSALAAGGSAAIDVSSTATANSATGAALGDNTDTVTASLTCTGVATPCSTAQQSAGGHTANGNTTVYGVNLVTTVTSTANTVASPATYSYFVTVVNNSFGNYTQPAGWNINGALAHRATTAQPIANTPMTDAQILNVTTNGAGDACQFLNNVSVQAGTTNADVYECAVNSTLGPNNSRVVTILVNGLTASAAGLSLDGSATNVNPVTAGTFATVSPICSGPTATAVTSTCTAEQVTGGTPTFTTQPGTAGIPSDNRNAKFVSQT